MAQATDYNLANQTTAAFRTELNNILSAIATVNGGASAPATTYPGMLWIDTSASSVALKIRNQANTGWTFIGNPESANLGLVSAANPTLTGAVTVPTAATSSNTTIAASTAYVTNKLTTHGNWINPTLLNGWSTFGTPAVSYRLNNNGFVTLRGSVQKASAGTVELLFTLPVGLRPTQDINRYWVSTLTTVFSRILITPTGDVYAAFDTTPTGTPVVNLDMTFQVG